jgi:hypothetical protein
LRFLAILWWLPLKCVELRRPDALSMTQPA